MPEYYLGADVGISQDSRLAAWAEYLLGAGRNYRSSICVAVGTGIGGGIILDGKIFHGALNTPNAADAKNIKAKVLVLTGADDPNIKPEEVAAFEKEMTDAKVDWQLIKYSGTVHAFTNPAAGNDNSKGAAYNERADHRSWEAMKEFFAELFK